MMDLKEFSNRLEEEKDISDDELALYMKKRADLIMGDDKALMKNPQIIEKLLHQTANHFFSKGYLIKTNRIKNVYNKIKSDL